MGIPLNGTVQIGEVMDITDKECWRIVSDQIPVAFPSVELDGNTAYVAFTVGSSALSCDRGKSYEQLGLCSGR